MNRRSAISSLGLLGVSGIMLPSISLTGCHTPDYLARFFPQEDLALLDEIGETILPETADSPGAKAAFVGNCIDSYVADCYKPAYQETMLEGIAQFKQDCKENMGKPFTRFIRAEKEGYLNGMYIVAQVDEKNRAPEDPPHYFTLLRNLVVFSYFTSEVGATKALRYVPIPGRYVGDYPFEEGDKAWAI